MVRTVLNYDPQVFRDMYRKIWDKSEAYYQKKLESTLHVFYWWVGGSLVIGFLSFLHNAFLPVFVLGIIITAVMGFQYFHQRSLFEKKGDNFQKHVEEQITRLNTYEAFFLEFDDQTITIWMDKECYRSPWYVYDYMIRNEDYLYLSSVDPKRRHLNVLIPTRTVDPGIFGQLKSLAEEKIENKIKG